MLFPPMSLLLSIFCFRQSLTLTAPQHSTTAGDGLKAIAGKTELSLYLDGFICRRKRKEKKKSELWPLARDVSFLFLSLGNYKIMQPKSQSYNQRKPAKSLLQIQDDHLTPSFQPIIIPLTTWPTPRSCCFCNTCIPNPPPFLCLEVKISFSEESHSNSQWHACGEQFTGYPLHSKSASHAQCN